MAINRRFVLAARPTGQPHRELFRRDGRWRLSTTGKSSCATSIWVLTQACCRRSPAIILDIEDGVARTLKTAARASSATAPSPESDRHG